MELEAYLLPLDHSIARSELYFFINGRPVRNRSFLAAVRTAYLEQAGLGREPVGVIYLDMKNEWVDVNVHPQKWEVRCFNQESIYQWLLTVFRKSLSRSPRNSVNAPPQFFPRMETNSSPNYRPSRPFRFLAQTHKALICEDDLGLVISSTKRLTQHHFYRLIFDSLLKGSLSLKTISPPMLCQLNPVQRETLEKLNVFLKPFGLEFEHYGNNDFALRSYPDFQPQELLQGFLNWFCEQLNHLNIFKSQEHFAKALSEYYSSIQNLPLSDLLDEFSDLLTDSSKRNDSLIKRFSYNHLEGQE
jgi:DNA mismatch repair ATPase MutL